MKRFLFLLPFLLYLCCLLRAQDYRVVSVEHLPNDMSAREEIMTDERGRQCALLRIVTKDLTPEQRNGFYFQCDYASWVVERRIADGEILLWVSPGLKTLKIKHKDLGPVELQMTTMGIGNIESLHVYKMLIQGTLKYPQSASKPEPLKKDDEQYLLFNITPVNAVIFVDDEQWPTKDGSAQKIVKLGKHHYRVEAPDYHSDEGEVLVDDPTYTKMMKVNLNPAFGFLKIDDTNVHLSGANIYIDNETTARSYNMNQLLTLSSGQHKLRLTHPQYRPYSRTVTIADEQTITLKPRVKSNFITLDFAYSTSPQTSFGFTFGSVKRFGWFVTAASNFSFYTHWWKADENGVLYWYDDIAPNDDYYVNYSAYNGTGIHPNYTGESFNTRISIMTGIVFRVANPVYLKLGAGYGQRMKYWRISDGHLVWIGPDSYDMVDATAGIQIILNRISLGIDTVVGFGWFQGLTTFPEMKIGIGYNWKKLK